MDIHKMAPQTGNHDLVGQMIEFEQGLLPQAARVILFQHLIDTGLAFTLKAQYAKLAAKLIEDGLCRTAA